MKIRMICLKSLQSFLTIFKMSEEIKIILIFLVWLFSAYFGSFSSWGVSALGVWGLTLLGIPPQLATITLKLGKIGDVLWGIYHFYKHGHIPTHFLYIGGIASFVWSFLGTYLIFSIPDRIIYGVSATSMLILAFVAFIRKSGSQKSEKLSKKREYAYYVCLFFLNMIGNLFIAGSWVWYYFANTFILKLSAIEAKWIATAMSLFWFLGTMLSVMVQGQYVLSWAVALALGMFVGWWFGTKHIIKLWTEIMSRLLLLGIIILAWYFLYLAFAL